MTRLKWLILIAGIVLVVASGTALTLAQGRRNASPAVEGGTPVLAATAKTIDLPVYLDGVGTVQANKTVTVRAQVDGKLISVPFQEGQEVKPGDLLAKIDPSTYQASYDQAQAKKAQDEAALANARRDLERYIGLAKINAGSQQQADTQRAAVAQLEAQVKSDQAAVESTRATLAYTTITSPIQGRTGIRLVDEGNIVHAGDATGIVVVAQLKPISVLFTVPAQNLSRINRAAALAPLPVNALAEDNRTVRAQGSLQVVDNQVDPATGTVKLKASFPNNDQQLWPGQFINVKLLVETRHDALVVPVAAVQQGPSGPFVYLIQPGDTVTVRAVKVAQQDDSQAVVTDGLKPDDRVVTSGFTRLTEGAKVNVSAPGGGAPGGAPPVNPGR